MNQKHRDALVSIVHPNVNFTAQQACLISSKALLPGKRQFSRLKTL
jgi:hypothetical protein